MAIRRVAPALLVLLAVGTVLSTGWAILLPPLQGPDESAHIAATTRLVEEGSLDGSGGLPAELLVLSDERGLGPLIGNLAARPDTSPSAAARTERALRALGDDRTRPVDRRGGPPTRGSADSPLYAVWTAAPYAAAREASLVDRIALMRLLNVPLLLITIAACWGLAAQVAPASGLARVVAGGVAALQPQLAFLTGMVAPNLLLVALASVFCLVAAQVVCRGVAWWRVAGLLALAAAATATHSRGAVLIPCVALAVVLGIRWRASAPSRRRAAIAVGGIAAAVVVAGAVLALSSLTPYGGRPWSIREFASYLWQFYLPPLPFMAEPLGGDYGVRDVLETMWGTFASLEVRYPRWVFTGVSVGLVLAAAGLVAAIVRRRPAVVAGRRLLLFFGGLVVLTMASLHFSAYRLMLVDPTDPIIVGRHLLLLVSPLSLGFALAVATLPRRGAEIAAALLLGALVALDIAALGLTTARFYG